MAINEVGKRKYANYYSGTDIRIYFGDLWVDEISEIEWTMQEQVAPIYGFSSYTWDRVARGNRIVQGSFVINFKEAGYLQTIMNSLSSQMKEDKVWFSTNDFESGSNDERTNGFSQKSTSVESVIKNFATLSSEYEKALWGEESDTSKVLDARTSGTFFSNPNANANTKALKDHGFNILVTYGDTGDQSRGLLSHDTSQTIVGVQLTGVSQRVDPSGNPISEVYSFIAKDVSRNVTKGY